jgi:hypothetical protein
MIEKKIIDRWAEKGEGVTERVSRRDEQSLDKLLRPAPAPIAPRPKKTVILDELRAALDKAIGEPPPEDKTVVTDDED